MFFEQFILKILSILRILDKLSRTNLLYNGSMSLENLHVDI